MSAGRHQARIIAFGILYQLDITGSGNLDEKIGRRIEGKNLSEDAKDFILRLCRGVDEHREEIDGYIAANALNWSLERIAVVDRNIMRLAVYELLFCQDIPYRVVIDEAIEIGKQYGAEDSGPFINGILDKIAHGIPARGKELI